MNGNQDAMVSAKLALDRLQHLPPTMLAPWQSFRWNRSRALIEGLLIPKPEKSFVSLTSKPKNAALGHLMPPTKFRIRALAGSLLAK